MHIGIILAHYIVLRLVLSIIHFSTVYFICLSDPGTVCLMFSQLVDR
jgi:hypothetical protein